MKRALLLCALALFSCGPAPSAEPGFDLTLAITRGLLDDISQFQVALVSSGSSIDCVTAQSSCIKDQVEATRFVKLKDSAGQPKNALVFPIQLVNGTPNTQDLTLTDVPLGRDYALVVEAVGKTTPPGLAGSACAYVREVTQGKNAQVVANIVVHTPAVQCDPRIP